MKRKKSIVKFTFVTNVHKVSLKINSGSKHYLDASFSYKMSEWNWISYKMSFILRKRSISMFFIQAEKQTKKKQFEEICSVEDQKYSGT